MIKTVSLTAGTETKVEISGGYNVGVINYTTDMLYASRKSGVVAGADDVAAIPAGDSYTIRAADDTVYLLATAAGNVQLESIGAKEVFKIAAASSSAGGGSTTDEIARQAITNHANNTEIHHTEGDISEMITSAVSNPNLLINPNFKINQRGAESYTKGLTVDCWQTQTGFEVKPATEGVTVEPIAGVGSNLFGLREFIPFDSSFIGKSMTFSTEVAQTHDYAYCVIAAYNGGDVIKTTTKVKLEVGVNVVTMDAIPENATGIVAQYTINAGADVGDELKLVWGKMEMGANATAYCPPDPTTELTRCQRYYQLRSTGDIGPTDLRPVMATITDIKERSDGLYEYIAAD